MKKILFYTDTPLLGGAENQMLLLAKFLPREKFEITVACSDYKNLNYWCQDLMECGVKLVRLKVLHKHDPRHFLYLKKLLPNFDLMHLHVWNPASCRYGFLAAGEKPLVVTEHDPFVLRGLKGWLKNKLALKAASVIVASEAAKRIVLEQNPELANRITVIKNGIDCDTWKNLPEGFDRDEFRRKHFGAAPDDRVILCVAELHERKGQKYLIEAYKEVAEKEANVKLIFVGDGPQKNQYQKMAAPLGESVQFLGQRRDVRPLMAAADIFVLPSVREAFGLVLLEASLSGLPVIATRVGGIPEIIEDGKTGFLVETKNDKSLASAIEKVLTNLPEAKKLIENAKQKVETEFSAKIMAERTAEVYAQAL